MPRRILSAIQKMFRSKKVLFAILAISIFCILYVLFFQSITINPATETRQMERLELAKQTYVLDEFSSDGCSGNVSSLWKSAVASLSSQSTSFSERYASAQTIPFESACVAHDKTYHQGDGGYVARLQADNQLRTAIIDYGINNADEIKNRTGISSTEQVIFMYEFIAESVYRGVRLGGAPCTGMSYAWGFGYNNGHCQ